MGPEDKVEAVPQGEPSPDRQEVSQDRREAMLKLGKYSAYVAPAMLALVATRNAAAS
jgi:hypothetical protein